MTWPIDKLGLINEMLALTGNNLCAVPDDGSDEWTTASAAYEAAIEYMFEAHDWKQITNVVVLPPTGTVPTDPMFTNAYVKPADCIHVIWVRINDMPIAYQILNNQIVIDSTWVTNGIVTLKYVSSSPPGVGDAPTRAADQMTRTFMTALKSFVMSGIYRGLHEDLDEARRTMGEARLLVQEARTRSDQEQPKRAPFNSRAGLARRVRRPFPSTPTGWGGTGIPS